MKNELLSEFRKKVVEAIGLEDFEGDKDMYLIRDINGVVENGIDFSDEVDEIVFIFAKQLTEIGIHIEKELENHQKTAVIGSNIAVKKVLSILNTNLNN